MNVYNHIIVDVSNLVMRAYSTRPNDAGQHAANMLKKIIREKCAPKGTLYFLCDNWENAPTDESVTSRKELDPNYKSGRKYTPEQVHAVVTFHEWLKTVPKSYIIRHPGLEADDLLPRTIAEHCQEGFTLLVSADFDWACELCRTRHWYNFQNTYTPAEFEAKYEYPPSRNSILTDKAILGDKSDRVKNAHTHLVWKDVLRIIKANKPIPEILENCPNEIADLLPALQKVRDQLLLNWKLLSPMQAGPSAD